MAESVESCNHVRIRLTYERWAHVTEEHSELAGMRDEVLRAIEFPERVVAGNAGELFALRHIEPRKVLVVVYKEIDAHDGFVITAFVTTRLKGLDRRPQVWPPRA